MLRVWLLTIVLSIPSVVYAQTDFIVRLSNEDTSGEFSKMLRAEVSNKQHPYTAYLAGVNKIAPIGPGAGASKRVELPFEAYVITVIDSAAQDSLMSAWEGLPEVAYVQFNNRYKIDSSVEFDNDPYLDSLSHFSVSKVFEAWTISRGDRETSIGFIDTGVYLEHPDLVGQFGLNTGEDINGNGRVDPSDYNGVDDDGNGYVDDLRGYDFVDRAFSVEVGDYLIRDPDPSEDDQMGGGRGHGTLVAGILAARDGNNEGISGVAPRCRLIPLRAFGADGRGDDDDVVAAILYAAQEGIDVLNLSFGDVYYSPLMREAIKYAVDLGTIVIASAGNLGGDDPHYPSDYPEVISTAWLDAEGESIASRGAHGSGIDIGAPGSFIFTTMMPPVSTLEEGNSGGEVFYGRRSGSSLAAPIVSGAAALLRSVAPELSPASVHSILTGSAIDIGEPGWDHKTAAGRLDVASALSRALPARVELSFPDNDAGWDGSPMFIRGTVVDPAFESYSLYYASGTGDVGEWQVLAGPITTQHFTDTLAVWNSEGLSDGDYTLRLEASLRTGRTLEDRRRIVLDRSPPEILVNTFNVGLIEGKLGIVADLETDDITNVKMTLSNNGDTTEVTSDRQARLHVVAWPDDLGRGGTVDVTLTATNLAGSATSEEVTFLMPHLSTNSALFEEHELSVPHGYLLPESTDFDADGLLEITLNQFERGWVGDTLATYEWIGNDFRPALKSVANVIPRDTGDIDGDGLQELLTQVAGATLILEQRFPNEIPTDVAFVDTTGLSNPFDPGATFGSRLTDFDEDGRGELLAHNTKEWRLLESTGQELEQVLVLSNPTGTGNSEISQNEFQQPNSLVGDFDGDGRLNLLVGDGDGDWIIYESKGDDDLAVSWSYETDRYNAGSRMEAGDFDGDGVMEFVTFTQNWTQPTSESEREPDLGLYYLWDSEGDDQYSLRDSIPIPGLISRHGSLKSVDWDLDGKDELVLIHPPSLYVLSFEGDMSWNVLHHKGEIGSQNVGVRSVSQATGDFDGDGFPELIVGGADENLHRFTYKDSYRALAPPRWEHAAAENNETVSLAWYAPESDSVQIYSGPAGGELDKLILATDSPISIPANEVKNYALKQWRSGKLSPLSEMRTVRPHSPAIVTDVTYPRRNTVALFFSEPLQDGLQPGQFTLDHGGASKSLLYGKDDQLLLLQFDNPTTRIDTLRWMHVTDAEGTLVGINYIPIAFPDGAVPSLIIADWDIVDLNTIRLKFNEPLDEAFASNKTHYQVQPAGSVERINFDISKPDQVELEIAGQVIGPTGLESSLVVLQMKSATGNTLAAEGNTILLSQSAEDLSNVYVFPNPLHEGRHGSQMMIAGLPGGATVEIYSLDGTPLVSLSEQSGTGGVYWDLKDNAGMKVPSGIYLLRVEIEGQKPVLKKAAIIR